MSTLTVTLIQPDLKWEDKAANLDQLEQKIFSIPVRTELVILPEMFSTGFSMQPAKLAETMEGMAVAWMRKVAAAKKVILTGSLIIEENGKYFNRLIWMLPNGQLGFYDKRHRFAYAGEDQEYSPGHKRLIASVKGWKLNLQVCYDLRFPVWARQSNNGTATANATEEISNPDDSLEYDVLIYVANWPERRSHAWKTLLQARAIENQCYVIGVNRVGIDGHNINHSGDSMIVDPLGAVLYQKTGQEDVFTCTLEKEKLNEVRIKYPFWKDADAFQILNPQQPEP